MSDAITAARRIFYEHDGPWLRCRAAERLGWDRYSHPALFDMDLRLAELMPWRGGTFVEAGAHDGFTQSNTYYLERRCGWSGVLVEPLPELREKCARRRPRSRVFGCALVGEDRDSAEVDIHFGDLMSSVVDRAHAAGGLALRRRQTYTVSVPARTLSSVLDEAGVGSIDLLVLDVEGNELEALRGLDLERHTPRYMLIEALELEAMRPVFVDALAPRYVLAEEPSPYDLLFRRSDR